MYSRLYTLYNGRVLIMRLVIYCLALVGLLFNNWTSIGPDRERQELEHLRNSRGHLVKL